MGDIALVDGASAATVCLWVKPASFSSDGSLFADWDGSSSTDGIYFWLDNTAINSGRADTVSFTVNVDINANRVEGSENLVEVGVWQHFCGVFSGSSFYRLYKNAQLDTETTSSVPATVMTGDYVSIGDTITGTSRDMHGLVDDVRVYNRALSTEDIQVLYADERSGNLRYNTAYRTLEYHDGVEWRGIDRTGVPTEDGLIGHWKFDDGSGSTAVDSAGSADGTLTNMDPNTDWVTGQIGGALDFDGVDDTVAAPSTYDWASGDFSVAFWINIDNYIDYERIVYVDDQFLIAYGDGGNRLSWNVEPDDVDGKMDTPDILGTDVWKHVVFVYDKATTSGQFYIDSQSQTMSNNNPALMGWDNTTKTDNTIFFMARDDVSEQDGMMDDVRIYNRALSVAEIQDLYNYTLATGFNEKNGLVGHWKLNETTGTTAVDATGNNEGTMQNGLDASTDSVAGQVGTALNFDGIGDYIEIPNSALLEPEDEITVSAWVNWTDPASGTFQKIFALSKDDQTSPYQSYALEQNMSQTALQFEVNIGGTLRGSGAYTVTSGSWIHVVGTWGSGEPVRLYVNGALASESSPYSGNIVYYTMPANIGRGSNGEADTEWAGQIDDVRVYSRALSAEDIHALYAWGYQGGATCSNPAGDPGRIIYNTTHEVMQYCDGAQWQPMGLVPGTGGAACSSPAGDRGSMIFNTTYNVMQYCDGTNWRTIAQRN